MPKTEILPELKGEKSIDDQMVIDAKIKIKSIITEHFGAAVYEVVDYLLETFFDGDKENLSQVRLKGHKTFQNLLEEIQDETGKSKSWVYESINLWKDRELLSDFEPYMQLSISHRALLLKVSDVDEKKEYAQSFFDKQLPYQKAKQEVRKEPPATDYSALSRLISRPKDLDEDSFNYKSGKVALQNAYTKLNVKQQIDIIKKANDRVGKIEKGLTEQKELLKKAKTVQDNLNRISGAASKNSKD